jgi:WD40 repeat protein
MMMLQSLASQMCENVVGFKEKLIDQLKRPHEVQNLNEAFGIYLQNPLDELELTEPILIVIDGLDESAADDKNEIVNLIADYFPVLPEFIKVLVTSRPEISVAKLTDFPKINIENSNADNDSDLNIYLQFWLPRIQDREDSLEVFENLVKMCEGSFLYAFFLQIELLKRNDLHHLLLDEITDFLPNGLDSVYQKYFHRLEEELKAIMLENFDLLKVLKMLVASNAPLPLKFITRALGLASDCRETKIIINKVNVAVSCLLYVSEDLVTVFHKSVVDWLLGEGYKDHEYTVKFIDGNRLLWVMCQQIFEEIKKTVCSGLDLNLTNELMYALMHGLHHLTTCEMNDCYTWLVDVVIVHVLLTISDICWEDMLLLWKNVLRVNGGITNELRARISWHILELELILNQYNNSKCNMYLTSVLAHSPKGYFSENERKIAASVLSKFPRLVDNDRDHQVKVRPLACYYWLGHFSAVGLSINRSAAAVAGKEDGILILVDLPSLVELWQYDTGYQRISCCIFSPDDSLVLFGKLETALSIAERKEVPFFHSNKETFVSCGFSPNGKRLVTSNGSSTIKLWDIAKQILLSSFCTELPVYSCSFSSTGLFIIANRKSEIFEKRKRIPEDSFCVWNAVTWHRCDERNKTEEALLGEQCKRCFPATSELQTFRGLNVKPCQPLPLLGRRFETWCTGIFNQVECHFALGEQSLSVVENTHFTTLACWNFKVYEGDELSEEFLRTMIAIKDDLWLYASYDKLVVFRTAQKPLPHMPRPVFVYSSAFSPDGSKLATCTSDGFVNIWNVDKSQVDQRLECSQEESISLCWWSKKFLFVFHVLDGIPTLSKFPMDATLKLLPSQRDVRHFPAEFFGTVADFSQGFLIFESIKTNTVSLLDIKRIARFQMVTLPQIEPNMMITISSRCSFVFGSGKSMFYIWKRIRVKPPVYKVFFKESHSKRNALCDSQRHCAFSSNSKIAVIAYPYDFKDNLGFGQDFQIIYLDTGNYKTIRSYAPFFYRKLFCFSGVFIGACSNEIRIFDVDTGAIIETSFQRDLTGKFLMQMKLSPNKTAFAVPMMNGDVEFIRLSIAK